MESVIEQQRQYHEETERLFAASLQEYMVQERGQKEKINAEHHIGQLVDRICQRNEQLLATYADGDGERAKEMAAIAGPDEFGEFYTRLASVREYHKKYPNEIAEPMTIDLLPEPEYDEEGNEKPSTFSRLVDFSGEEGYGKYLDLHACYALYINLKGTEAVDYLDYITQFQDMSRVPHATKNNNPYKRYVQQLSEYLLDFLRRARPLSDVDAEVAQANQAFEEAWAAGTVAGWPSAGKQAGNGAAAPVDLSQYASAAACQALGLDGLKQALTALGLKCGGTLEQRAERLFMTKGKRIADLDKSLFAKKPKGGRGTAAAAAGHGGGKEVARLEAVIVRLAGVLSGVQQQTRENVERKQARTAEELEEESEEAAVAMITDSEEEEEEGDIPYNPKNLPLGWDGKPIPYWLYKLHGLNVTYTCEICGDATYKGPKAFQQHFTEWRHAHGMRCLGIPNTKHFNNVTLVNDARALWEKLQKNKDSNKFNAMQEEEYEDSQGNVVNKKTYEDLKRQGLL